VLFKIAGLLYSILAALSALCFLYTSLQGLAPRYKWLQARGVGYLTPMFYALAVLVYFVITIAFTEKPDVSLSSEYALTFDIGALLMLAAELFAIAEAVVYVWLNRPVPPVERPLESPLLEG
jgi:NADH:ubiquinone oxidoreductase subunit 6 (subunit J)